MRRFVVSTLLILAALGPAARAQNAIEGDPLDYLNADRYGAGTLIAAMEQLAVYGPDQAVDPVRLLLAHPDPDVARTAGWLLRRMGNSDASVAAAAGVLADAEADPLARASAALALGELRSAGGAGPLRTALAGDAEPAVRTRAATALGALSRAGSAGALAGALAGDADAAVRREAARALGGAPDADPAVLVAALADAEFPVRREAAWSLGRLKARSSVGNLAGTLANDPDCRVRAAAAWALGTIRDPLALEALTAAQDSDCKIAAQAASWALRRFE